MARPREHSDGEILDAAAEVLMEHGGGVATSVIAARLGLSTAALFHRFGSKRNLILQALVPKPPKLEQVQAGPDDRPVRVQLEEIGQGIAAHMQAMAPRIRTLHSAGISIHEVFRHFEAPPPVLLLRAMSAWFARAMEQGLVVQGNPEDLAVAFLGSLHGRHFFGGVLEVPLASTREDYIASATSMFALRSASAQEREKGRT